MEDVIQWIIVIAIVYWISFGGFCAWLAGEKGRNVLAWFVLGIVFGFVALLTLVGAPTLGTEGRSSRWSPSQVRDFQSKQRG